MKSWQKLPVFQTFGDTIVATAELVEWRVHTRLKKVQRVSAYYPGFTPVDRAASREFRLYVDIDASQLNGASVTWHDAYGKYTFTADREQPEAANHVLEHAISRLCAIGQAIDEINVADFTATLPPSPDPSC